MHICKLQLASIVVFKP